MRLSAIQKDILFLLYVIKKRGFDKSVPGMTLLNMIKSSRSTCSLIENSNFRASCHTLNKHGLISEFRGKGHTLAWQITPAGAHHGKLIYDDRETDQ